MDLISVIVVSIFCLVAMLTVIKMVRDNSLMRNGEKVDAKVLSFQLTQTRHESGRIRYRYEVRLKYNVTGADYQSNLTMTRQIFDLAFPALVTDRTLPEITMFKPSDLNSVGKIFGGTLDAPISRPLVSELFLDEETLEGLTLPVSVDRLKPQRVVLNLDKVLENNQRTEKRR